MILAAPCPSFEELSSVERGRRLGRLARHALDQYGITPRSIRMVREGFCTTFRVMDHDRQVYALKAGRMGTETVESLRFEAELVAHIRAHGLPVPQVVLSSDGTPVVVATDCIAGTRPCILYTWLPGRRELGRMSMRAGRELGRLLGRMHSAMETFRPSRCERKTWRVKQMCGWWRGPDPLEDRLTRDELRLVRVWEKRIAASWRRKRDVSSWGLVLADVGPHNVIWHEGVASLIDFNDTGWGLSAYDLAVLWHSAIDRRQTACDAVIGGYASVRAIPGGWGPPMQAAALIRVLRHRITRGRDHRKALGLLLDISEEKTSMSSS